MSIKAFKLLTGCNDDELANLLLDQATSVILSETKRTKIIPELESAVLNLAIIMYNRLGTEGETSRSEGGISIAYEQMPTGIKNAIDNYRLVKVSGHAFECKKIEESNT